MNTNDALEIKIERALLVDLPLDQTNELEIIRL
jgi:hypothetical protein